MYWPLKSIHYNQIFSVNIHTEWGNDSDTIALRKTMIFRGNSIDTLNRKSSSNLILFRVTQGVKIDYYP